MDTIIRTATLADLDAVAAVEAARDRYIAPMEQKNRKKGDAE